MNTRKRIIIVLVFLLSLGLAGCGPGQAFGPTLTSIPTDTPTPTDTLRPPNTPIPTRVHTSTETPTPKKAPTDTVPAPDISLEYLNGVRVVFIDTFDDPSRGGWGLSPGALGIKNGVLELSGKSWNGFQRKNKFTTGKGLIIDFSYTPSSVFTACVYNGQPNTDLYKRFGVYLYNTRAVRNILIGKYKLESTNLSGKFVIKPDTTYSLLLAVLPKGGFLTLIWDPSSPAEAIYYRVTLGADWADLNYYFRIDASNGTVQFDNYREIVFDSVK